MVQPLNREQSVELFWESAMPGRIRMMEDLIAKLRLQGLSDVDEWERKINMLRGSYQPGLSRHELGGLKTKSMAMWNKLLDLAYGTSSSQPSGQSSAAGHQV